ncbi:hypothetical protein [Halogeometricum limi]|uniref:Uncharacterized protein n=1 Tax=Halogeometricum limi TaxID=555875 RepID=A0A1I6G0T2_9EURY|nr:hypothetical protein [Halogeometricum limi]SFR35795.1 hypothetical protein SAMN04488124_0678 [Halogeometricum limi]
MDRPIRSSLDWAVAATGFITLVVGVGVLTESPLSALGTAFFLAVTLALVYPFARFAGANE